MSCVCALSADVVTVALDQLSYDVSESEGSVEVCVGLSTGQLARDLVVTLSTQSGSAGQPSLVSV